MDLKCDPPEKRCSDSDSESRYVYQFVSDSEPDINIRLRAFQNKKGGNPTSKAKQWHLGATRSTKTLRNLQSKSPMFAGAGECRFAFSNSAPVVTEWSQARLRVPCTFLSVE